MLQNRNMWSACMDIPIFLAQNNTKKLSLNVTVYVFRHYMLIRVYGHSHFPGSEKYKKSVTVYVLATIIMLIRVYGHSHFPGSEKY